MPKNLNPLKNKFLHKILENPRKSFLHKFTKKLHPKPQLIKYPPLFQLTPKISRQINPNHAIDLSKTNNEPIHTKSSPKRKVTPHNFRPLATNIKFQLNPTVGAQLF